MPARELINSSVTLRLESQPCKPDLYFILLVSAALDPKPDVAVGHERVAMESSIADRSLT